MQYFIKYKLNGLSIYRDSRACKLILEKRKNRVAQYNGMAYILNKFVER